MQKFTELRVWQRSHQLILRAYEATRVFPSDELHGMRSQLRRAVVSISANVAEGSKRESRVDFARFVNHAEASAAEAEALTMAARDLGYLNPSDADWLLAELDAIGRMLSTFRKVLRAEPAYAAAQLQP